MTKKFKSYNAMIKWIDKVESNLDVICWYEEGKGFEVEYTKAMFTVQLNDILVYTDSLKEAIKVKNSLNSLGNATITRH